MTIKLKLVKDVVVEGNIVEAGTVEEYSEKTARELIRSGSAEFVSKEDKDKYYKRDEATRIKKEEKRKSDNSDAGAITTKNEPEPVGKEEVKKEVKTSNKNKKDKSE